MHIETGSSLGLLHHDDMFDAVTRRSDRDKCLSHILFEKVNGKPVVTWTAAPLWPRERGWAKPRG
jgi:hypothetical protein